MNPARKQQMEMALENAGPQWANAAYRFILEYAASHEAFTGEDVSDLWLAMGKPLPVDLRAFGGLYRRAKHAGVIVMDGTGWSKRRSSICPKWKSLIYRRQAA